MKCCICFHSWLDNPGAYGEHFSGCPKCKSLYWTWAITKEELQLYEQSDITD